MFYNHEILTSRKHGVATIWLVATLGSRASSKKVNKKSILEVNIPKACDVVIEPEAPMALRLQSNLLCGISRVYSQQCGYILVDAQNIQQQMRHLIRLVQTQSNDLDLETGRAAKPDALILPDDPGFLPDLDAELDFNLVNLSTATTQSLSEDHHLSSQARVSSQASDLIMPDIQLPSSSAEGGVVQLGDFGLPTESNVDTSGALYQIEADDGLLPEADFTFDEQGNLSGLGNTTLSQAVPNTSVGQDVSNTVLHEPGRQRERTEQHDEPREGRSASHNLDPADLALGPLYEDPILPEAASPLHQNGDQVSDSYRPSSQHMSPNTAAAALSRRSRIRRGMRSDQTTEIRKTELRSWSSDYLSNMETLRKKRDAAKAGAQAKKNAEWWVWGTGLGGVGYDMRGLGAVNHPLGVFQGQQLRDLILGPTSHKKRPSSEVDEHGRRIRQRTGEAQPGQVRDEDGDLLMGMDDELDLETARRAPTPEDQRLGLDLSSSAMPWNRSATAHSSQLGRGRVVSLHSRDPSSGLTGFLQRQRSRAGSRLTSASPLHGRGMAGRSGSRRSSVGPIIIGEPGSLSSGGDKDIVGSNSEFDRFGPAAAVDSLEANASQWVRKQLDLESMNFLVFVQQAVDERRLGDLGESGISEDHRVLFEDLLEPQSNTHVVAAQGLLHVLTLATKGLMWVQQNQYQFGEELWLGVVDGAVASDVVRETALEGEAPITGEHPTLPMDVDDPAASQPAVQVEATPHAE